MVETVSRALDKLTRKSIQLLRAARIEREAIRTVERSIRDSENFERFLRAIARYKPSTHELLYEHLHLGGPRVAHSHIKHPIYVHSRLLAGGVGVRPVMPDGRQYFHFKLTSASRGGDDTFTDGTRRLAHPADHQSYIERADALEILPSGPTPKNIVTPEDAAIELYQGGPMFFTNIGMSPEVRRDFWERLVENERQPGPPRIRVSDPSHPWWASALADHASRPASDRMTMPLEIITAYHQLKSRPTSPTGRKREVEVEVSAARYSEIARWLAFTLTFGHDYGATFPVAALESRGGRVQYRLIAELPYELSPVGRFKVMHRMASIMNQMRVPFSLAGHQPGDHNDGRNYHFHLIYSDRPSIRCADGRWDFEPTGWDVRHQRQLRANIQPKNRELNHRNWPKEFRRRYAEIVNDELAAEGIVGKRYDPRKLEEIVSGSAGSGQTRLPGSQADNVTSVTKPAAVKLGSGAAALERRGVTTAPGTAESIARSLEVIDRADRQYNKRLRDARALTAPFRDVEEARPIAARFLRLSRQFAAIGRDRALHQEAKRAALSRPTAALHHLQQLEDKLRVDVSAKRRSMRLQKLEKKIAEQRAAIAQIRLRLDPEWILLMAKADLLDKRRPELRLLLDQMAAVAKARGEREAGEDYQQSSYSDMVR